MMTVKQGEIYILNHPEYIHDETDRPVKSFYFIDKVQNEEICDAIVITYWRNSIPTLWSTTGPISNILAPTEGAVHQGTQVDWNRALYRVFDVVENYTRWIYKLNPQEEKE